LLPSCIRHGHRPRSRELDQLGKLGSRHQLFANAAIAASARGLIAVRWRAILMMPESERPSPKGAGRDQAGAADLASDELARAPALKSPSMVI
jgi:hypothetical protein